MPTLTIVIDFSSDDREVIDLVSSDEDVLDLVSSESSSEASTDDAGSSSSSDDSSSYLPSWTCLPDGNWLQIDELFDDCDGIEEESISTTVWYTKLISRQPKKRYVPSASIMVDGRQLYSPRHEVPNVVSYVILGHAIYKEFRHFFLSSLWLDMLDICYAFCV